jgi:hypothetical protein
MVSAPSIFFATALSRGFMSGLSLLAKTTFSMIKAKFGQRLRSKSLTGQINEALCKVLCHNCAW